MSSNIPSPARPERHSGAGDLPHIDVTERGAPRDGVPQELNRRLFMQLIVLSAEADADLDRVARSLNEVLASHSVGHVIYEDVSDLRGLGVLTWAEDPSVFVSAVRTGVNRFSSQFRQRLDFTMLGRTYSSGYEADVAFWLLDRPRDTVLNADWPWAIWYPLRRSGAFAKLEPREQGAILREHGTIGRAYGAQNLAHDVRLACHGLDVRDNEFVIGLVGPELHPLSHIVQTMRKTRQTSEFIQQMGPFFVGRAILRHRG